jgi:hypothetical protein
LRGSLAGRLRALCTIATCAWASGCADNEISAVAPNEPVVQDSSGCKQGTVACGPDCFDLQWDPSHCGTCDHECSPGASCFIGLCASGCDAGLESCFGGCIDTLTDNANCGGCDVQCHGGAKCANGVCSCGPPESPALYCSDKCVNKNLDFENCGKCGNQCSPQSPCVNGICQP